MLELRLISSKSFSSYVIYFLVYPAWKSTIAFYLIIIMKQKSDRTLVRTSHSGLLNRPNILISCHASGKPSFPHHIVQFVLFFLYFNAIYFRYYNSYLEELNSQILYDTPSQLGVSLTLILNIILFMKHLLAIKNRRICEYFYENKIKVFKTLSKNEFSFIFKCSRLQHQ